MEQPNLTYIKQLAKGDIIFEKKITSILKNELNTEIKDYFLFLDEKNYKKTQEIVHKIKHKISILGLEKTYEITNTFENNLRKNSTKNKEKFESMLPVMTNFLEKI